MATRDQDIAQKEHYPAQLNVDSATKQSQEKQLHFVQQVKSSKDFRSSEKEAATCDSLEKLDIFMQHWMLSREKFDHNQQRGCRKWLRKYQHAGVDVQRGIDDFKPFIQILQTFLPPPANMAVGATIGTIAIFFVLLWVANNKENIETRLDSTISGVIARLPGIKLYQYIYDEEHELDHALQASVVEIYSKLSSFLIQATNYYKSRGRTIWSRALREPESFQLDAQNIQDCLARIQSQCEVLMHKKLHRIDGLNRSIKALNKIDIHTILELQEENDMQRLEHIQELLRLETFSEDKRREELESYQVALNDTLDPVRCEPMDDQAFERFEMQEMYQAWLKALQPCLLVLSAQNYGEIGPHCWLSPVAVKVIQKLPPAGKNTFTSYCLVKQTPELLVGDVMEVVLFQLLKNNSQALRQQKQYNELCAAAQEYRRFCDGRAKEDEMAGLDRFSSLQTIVSRVLAFFDETDIVYIIIDRVDWCRVKGQDHRKKLMRTLVRMVEEARCRLKILAVVDKKEWAVEENRDDIGDRHRGRVIIHTAVQRGRYYGVDL